MPSATLPAIYINLFAMNAAMLSFNKISFNKSLKKSKSLPLNRWNNDGKLSLGVYLLCYLRRWVKQSYLSWWNNTHITMPFFFPKTIQPLFDSNKNANICLDDESRFSILHAKEWGRRLVLFSAHLYQTSQPYESISTWLIMT